MTDTMVVPDTKEWKAVQAHYETARVLKLRDLFAADPGRAERFSVEAAGLFLDYSKNRITDETVRLLLDLARARGVAERRDAMFSGEKINVSEGRAVLHVALRAPRSEKILVDGKDVVPEVHEVLDRMAAFADKVRSGEWKGHSGKRIRTVVNIGIGGSYLGPEMAYRALRTFRDPDDRRPLCRQCRRRRLREGDRRRRSARDAVHHRLQDLHDAGNHDQRRTSRATGSSRASAPRRRRQTFRRALDQCRRRSRNSASTPPTCLASGTGSAAAIRWIPPSGSRP